MSRSYSVGEFATELGVHRETVKCWCRDEKLDYVRTPGGHRRIPHRELLRLSGESRPSHAVALYVRTYRREDLDHQRSTLADYARDNGWHIETTYTDVGSGLDETRNGLEALLEDVPTADYGCVLVTTRDRLSRFGCSYIERFLDHHGVHLTTLEEGDGEASTSASSSTSTNATTSTTATDNDELAAELRQIVEEYGDRLYGAGSKKQRALLESVERELQDDS